MSVQVSQAVVLILGITVFVLSVWGMFSPARLMKMVSHAMDQKYGMYLAVSVRLVLGAALIIVAPISQFPTTFSVLGWLTIVAAIGLILVGRDRVRRIIAWFEQLSMSAVRIWLLFGMAFAGFLIYGVV